MKIFLSGAPVDRAESAAKNHPRAKSARGRTARDQLKRGLGASAPIVASRHSAFRSMVFALISLFLVGSSVVSFDARASAETTPCAPPTSNTIACENLLPGTPESDWGESGSGDPSIQGFATAMSVNVGETVEFKILTTAVSYHIDILRLGYYQGNGARKIAPAVLPSAPLPQEQPSCLTFSDTGLIDCGNWAVSASWAVPETAVSGVYIAHLVREDTGGGSLIPFVVRNDASTSSIVFQTSDETWQAYNDYGGNSLYVCTVDCPAAAPAAAPRAAFKVSYNRPFKHNARSTNWLMATEVPMIRFLEANGYDVTYLSGLDTSIRGPLLLNHKVFLSTGHDEYWAGSQRTNVETARDAGVNLAFFSGNEMFWKTRWEPSADESLTANRTLVCYKDTHFNAPTDPVSWTGTWRDPRFGTAGGGGNPENSLTGQFFLVNAGSTDIKVPAEYANMRLWRNTDAAALTGNQSLILGPGLDTLGYEWDVDADNGFRPAGAFKLSSTTIDSREVFTDYGSNVAPGRVTHNLTMYRAASGALVFGAGTVQWSYGLDGYTTGRAPDRNMKQATVNLLADMGAQPAALTTGLVAAAKSTDETAPTSVITSGLNGQSLVDGTKVTVTGTAADVGGVVAGVEVSTDGGATWRPATGRDKWTFSWVAHGSPSASIKTRAVDDSGNLETPGGGASVNISCPCSIWGPNVAPDIADSGDTASVELGLRFSSDTAGTVTGVRFYKSTNNTGTHSGSLWTATGQRLATAEFSGESEFGWQTVAFSAPVAVEANTAYVVSYFAPEGHYAHTPGYMYAHPSPMPAGNGSVDSAPLHAARNSTASGNGLYTYSGASGFPVDSVRAENYWVDVVFMPADSASGVLAAPVVISASPASGASGVPVTTVLSATFDQAVSASSMEFTLEGANNSPVPGAISYDGGTRTVTFTPTGALTAGGTYTATISGATNPDGQRIEAPYSWSFSVVDAAACPCSVFGATDSPAIVDVIESDAVELGMKFRSDVPGTVTGIRFYKASQNTGTHTGNLWSSSGELLASVSFSGETNSGWQQATFSVPVAIVAGTTYVVSYHAPNGHFSVTRSYFATGADRPPLHGLASGSDGLNGVYQYGASGFPAQTYAASNYWVDVVFEPGGAAAPG